MRKCCWFVDQSIAATRCDCSPVGSAVRVQYVSEEMGVKKVIVLPQTVVGFCFVFVLIYISRGNGQKQEK